MKSLTEGRSLEDVVASLLEDVEVTAITNPVLRNRVKVQRLRGEMRKYLARPVMYARQIGYLRGKIRELEDETPEIRIPLPKRQFE